MRELGRIMELGDDLRLSVYAKTMFLNMVQSAGSYPISIILNGLTLVSHHFFTKSL